MTRTLSALCALSTLVACGGDAPWAVSVQGLSSLPSADHVDIQLHPPERTCAEVEAKLLEGRRPVGSTGTAVSIDGELLFAAIANGVYAVSAVAYAESDASRIEDNVLYGWACEAGVELKAGKVTTVQLTMIPFAQPITEVP